MKNVHPFIHQRFAAIQIIAIVAMVLMPIINWAQPPSAFNNNPNAAPANDTTKVQIIYAESLLGRVDNGERVKTLVGNVQLQQNDVDMRCDSAVLLGNDVRAYGNVVIIQADTVQIFSDSAYYFGDNRKTRLVGEVVLTDGNAKFFTDVLDYDLNTKIATYNTGAILESGESRLRSDRGYYYSRQNIALFGGNVAIADPNFSLKSDTLKLDTDKNISYFVAPTDILTKDGEQIYCEGGFYDANKNYAEFEKRARLKSSDGFARAKKIRYDGKNDKIYLAGEAYFKNEEQTANSDTILFNSATKQISTIGQTTIEEADRVIIADQSFYDDSVEVAVFVGNVCISDSNQIICADSIRYDEATKNGRAFGNVVSRDTVEDITLECDRLDYNDSTSFAIATGRPLMTSVVSGDSLFLAADTLISYSRDSLNSDSSRILIAIRKVRVYKSDFQAVCDSLVYDAADSTFQFFIDPVMWSDTSQFTADTIKALLKNKKLDKTLLLQKAFVINSPDEVYFNQVKGRNIEAQFEDDSIQVVYVNGNGEAVYYIQDDRREYITANKTTCSQMKILFKNNDIKDIFFYVQPQGQTFPMKRLSPTQLNMEGFQWRVKERPKSKNDLRYFD